MGITIGLVVFVVLGAIFVYKVNQQINHHK